VHRTRSLAWLLFALPWIEGAIAAEPAVSGRVVGEDGKGIAQAVVFVQAPAESAATRTGPAPRATMDQINKTFVPGVLPIVAGSEVRFPNHDQVQHHVYSFSRTKNFELPLYKGQEAPPVRFDTPGVVKLGCNIHDWMSAVILVLPTTHFTMTDNEGRFTLRGLPPGKYTLAAWHELSRDKLEDTQQQVDVEASTVDVTFKLTLEPARTRPSMHGLRGDS
jgi:plastocyanin